MNKIRKGDQVIVLTGRDKGKRGTVSLRVDEDHIVVDSLGRLVAQSRQLAMVPPPR